jgi:hypothetical protein
MFNKFLNLYKKEVIIEKEGCYINKSFNFKIKYPVGWNYRNALPYHPTFHVKEFLDSKSTVDNLVINVYNLSLSPMVFDKKILKELAELAKKFPRVFKSSNIAQVVKSPENFLGCFYNSSQDFIYSNVECSRVLVNENIFYRISSQIHIDSQFCNTTFLKVDYFIYKNFLLYKLSANFHLDKERNYISRFEDKYIRSFEFLD